MAEHELEQTPGNEAVKLLVETKAARELYGAVSLAMGFAALAGPDQSTIDDAFFMIVRNRSALELLNALAVSFGFPLPPNGKAPEEADPEDVVRVVVGKSAASLLLNAVTVALGAGSSAEQDKGGVVVEIEVSKVTAIDLLNALVMNAGSVPAGKGGKGGLQDTGAGADPPGGGGGYPYSPPSRDAPEISLDDELATGRDLDLRLPLKKRAPNRTRRGIPTGGSHFPPGPSSARPKQPTSGRGLPREEGADHSPEAADEVDCTAYAPGEASPGNSFLVQVFAHLPEQAASLEAIAKEADPNAKRRVGRTLDKNIKRGSRLTFDLTMPHLEVDEPSQSLIWRGRPDSAQFAVTVPEATQPRDIICTVMVSENSIPIGHLKFTFKIVKGEVAVPDTPAVVGNLIRYKQAFISYASADRAEVLKRVQILNASKVKYFQDLLTLEPGDEWEKLIYQYIDESDVFYLFWSKAASESRWVKKELEYARKRQADKGDAPPEIVPILIEGPPPAKPPEELSFLHFNDKFLYFIKIEEDFADA